MIRFQTLGQIGLWTAEGGEVRPVLQQPKRLGLLAYLVLAGHGGFCRRDTLLALFWPELDEDHARNALRQSLHFLRRTIGSAFLINRGEEDIGVAPGTLWCDALEFQSALASGRPSIALDLYRGPLLDGVFIANAPEFERWLEPQRARLRDMAAAAAWELADAAGPGAAQDAVLWARRAAALSSGDEVAVQRLIRTYLRYGDRSSALHTYDSFARQLRDDYGVLPAQETRNLLAALREPELVEPVQADSFAAHPLSIPVGDSLVVPPAESRAAPSASRTSEEPELKRRFAHLKWAAGITVFLLLTVMIGIVYTARRRATGLSGDELAAPAIAVLPFAVSQGAGLESWREGLVDLLATNLDGLGGLRAIDSRTALARWREQAGTNHHPELSTVFNVASSTGARYALLGNAITAGTNLRLTAEIYDVAGKTKIGAVQATGAVSSVLNLVDQLSIATVQEILKHSGRELPVTRHIASLTTSSLPAMRAYLEGEALLRRSSFPDAVDAYERAIAADSTFTLAIFRLSEARSWIAPSQDESQADLERAGRGLSRLPAREALLVRATQGFGRLDQVRSLQIAAQKYPDDPDIWYELGEAYFHVGQRALLDRHEHALAFSRAVALDPAFSPYYIHLIESAIVNGDSVPASQLLARYTRVAAGTTLSHELRLAFDLALGSSVTRKKSRAMLDSIPSGEFQQLMSAFVVMAPAHEALETLARSARVRANAGPAVAARLTLTLLFRGRVHEALARFEDPLLVTRNRARAAYSLHWFGAHVPNEWLDIELVPRPGDTASAQWALVAGAHAADRDRWAEHQAAMTRARDHGLALRAGGDSIGARTFEQVVAALDGYGLWRRNRPAEAARALEAVRLAIPELSGVATDLDFWVRWWLGELAVENGRPRDAVSYFRSFWGFPFAEYRLGGLYEKLGDEANARCSYRAALAAWQQSDADFRPARAAREALARLAREGGANRRSAIGPEPCMF